MQKHSLKYGLFYFKPISVLEQTAGGPVPVGEWPAGSHLSSCGFARTTN
ncbi:uncharacterized protein METZ01_LOCUS472939, partial [marine metagenome]